MICRTKISKNVSPSCSPLSGDGTAIHTHCGPGSVQVTEANSTHPAKIRCTVERAAGNNDNIIYNPYLRLLSTENSVETVKRNRIVLDTDNSTLYEIVYRDINSTNSSQYLEFEYDIYMHQESTDYTIAMCGSRISNQTTGILILYCWAETYTLIRYNPAVMTVTETTPLTPPTTTHTTGITSTMYTTATSTVTVSISTPVPTVCPTPVCYTPSMPPPDTVPPPQPRPPERYVGITSGMGIAILVAVIELIVILLLVRSRRANDVVHPGEIHVNEVREDEREDNE